MKTNSPREFAAFGRDKSNVLTYSGGTHSFLNFDIRIRGEFLQSLDNVVDLLPDLRKIVIVPSFCGLHSPEGENLCSGMNVYCNRFGM